jgi:hypothetical protein
MKINLDVLINILLIYDILKDGEVTPYTPVGEDHINLPSIPSSLSSSIYLFCLSSVSSSLSSSIYLFCLFKITHICMDISHTYSVENT